MKHISASYRREIYTTSIAATNTIAPETDLRQWPCSQSRHLYTYTNVHTSTELSCLNFRVRCAVSRR